MASNNLNKRDMDSYLNYVCPNCFNKVYDCRCIGDLMPFHLIMIDNGIQEHVRILNQKGYITLDSCECHSKSCNTYISFRRDYGFGTTLPIPEGFKKLNKNSAVSTMYDTNMTDEEFEKKKQENLNVLLEWCKALPKLR